MTVSAPPVLFLLWVVSSPCASELFPIHERPRARPDRCPPRIVALTYVSDFARLTYDYNARLDTSVYTHTHTHFAETLLPTVSTVFSLISSLLFLFSLFFGSFDWEASVRWEERRKKNEERRTLNVVMGFNWMPIAHVDEEECFFFWGWDAGTGRRRTGNFSLFLSDLRGLLCLGLGHFVKMPFESRVCTWSLELLAHLANGTFVYGDFSRLIGRLFHWNW